MSVRSRQIMSDPGLRAALDQNETVLEYVATVAMAQGAERDEPVGTTPGRPQRESAGREVAGFLTGSWLPRWARGDVLDRAFGGVARQGVPGSLGARLHGVRNDCAGLVVTDRRLVAVRAGRTAMADDPDRPGRRVLSTSYSAVWSASSDDVRGARRRGRLTGRGRVELTFADASMCAVVAGVLTTSGARRLVAALDR